MVADASGHAKKIWNSTYGVYEALEAVNYEDPANVWIDVVAQIDLTPGFFEDSSVLDAQNAVSDPHGGTFADQSPLSGTDLDWFRFSVARSGSTWDRSQSELPEGLALSRIHWDREENPFLMGGFYDALTRGLVRLSRATGNTYCAYTSSTIMCPRAVR